MTSYCHLAMNGPKSQHPKKHFCWLPKDHEDACLNYTDSKKINDIHITGVSDVFSRIAANTGTQEDFQEAASWLYHRTGMAQE